MSERRRLGRRAPLVSRIGLGTAPLGNLFEAVPDAVAQATMDAAWEAGIRYFDTAPLYGLGLAETRVGAALARRPRDEFVLSTKVGRLLRFEPGADPGIFRVPAQTAAEFDFSRDGVQRSLEASLERLGLDRIDVVLVHDPDDHEAEALAGAFPALVALRNAGVVGAIGAGMNQAAMLGRFVERVDLDCVLLAGRYSLLDRSGAALLEQCAARGVGVILGGVFNSGVLARPVAGATFDYDAAPASVLARARALQKVCEEHEVSLPAAALGFALRHPAVSSVVVGARSAAEIRHDVALAGAALPDELWARLQVDAPG